MIFIKRTFNFGGTSDIRIVGLNVGFDVSDQLPDEAIENGISEALADQLGVENSVFAHTPEAGYPDYDDKRNELIAKIEGSHPNVQS